MKTDARRPVSGSRFVGEGSGEQLAQSAAVAIDVKIERVEWSMVVDQAGKSLAQLVRVRARLDRAGEVQWAAQ